MPMTFGAAAQVGNKNLNIDMRGFGGYAHQISGGYSQGRSVWGGRGGLRCYDIYSFYVTCGLSFPFTKPL